MSTETDDKQKQLEEEAIGALARLGDSEEEAVFDAVNAFLRRADQDSRPYIWIYKLGEQA